MDNLNFINEFLKQKMDAITQEMIEKEPEKLGQYRAFKEVENFIIDLIKKENIKNQDI